MPACPYAAKAWLDSKVDIVVRNPESGYTRDLHKHVKNINFNKKEILIYCDTYFKEYSLNKFQRVIDNFNRRYNKRDG